MIRRVFLWPYVNQQHIYELSICTCFAFV